MLREFMTCEEVRSQSRSHGIEDIAVVDRAYIEPNGMISVIRRGHEETEPVDPLKFCEGEPSKSSDRDATGTWCPYVVRRWAGPGGTGW